MADDKIDLLKKIKSLSERGVGGESVNAEHLLSKLMDKYEVTDADLSSERSMEHVFSYSSMFGRRLLIQIIIMVLGQNCKIWHVPGSKEKKVYATCTPSQKLEIESTFVFYRQFLDVHLEASFRAFVRREALFPKNGTIKDESDDIDQLSQRLVPLLDRHDMRLQLDGQTEVNGNHIWRLK